MKLYRIANLLEKEDIIRDYSKLEELFAMVANGQMKGEEVNLYNGLTYRVNNEPTQRLRIELGKLYVKDDFKGMENLLKLYKTNLIKVSKQTRQMEKEGITYTYPILPEEICKEIVKIIDSYSSFIDKLKQNKNLEVGFSTKNLTGIRTGGTFSYNKGNSYSDNSLPVYLKNKTAAEYIKKIGGKIKVNKDTWPKLEITGKFDLPARVGLKLNPSKI